MQLQDRLEAQEYGYSRSRDAMEIINRDVPRAYYANYLDSDAEFENLS